MGLADDQDPVENFSAERADHPFADRVRAGRLRGVLMILMLSAVKTASNVVVNRASRSRMRNRSVSARPARSNETLRAVWVTDSAVGSAVTPGRCTSPPAVPVAADVQVLRVQGDDALRFKPSSLVVRPGRIRVIFTVAGNLPQTFTSTALRIDSGNVPAGHTATLDGMVPAPGKYSFYSAYHQKQGMTGTIIAKT
jgi:plastocyanin